MADEIQETSDILRQINTEINDFETKEIQVVPGFYFNQKTTLEQIYRYYNGKYEEGDIDEDGDKKYFYNIVKNPCKVFSKAIDFDTKNIRLLTTAGGNELKTWFMERDLKYWMRDKQFGKVLNRIFYELPIYGSVVLKEVSGYLYFVDLRNFIVEQSADNLSESNYLIEIHNYTPADYRKVAKKMGWQKTDEVIEEFRKMKGVNHIRVYERYGEVEKTDSRGKKTYPYMRTFIADVGVDVQDAQTQKMIYHKGVLLREDEWEGNPYWEYHLEKIMGRWLGVGVVEQLFDNQIRENEVANLESKASYWRALVLFQNPDPTMAGKNLQTENKNGDVLDASNGLTTQVDISDRNLAYFNDQTNKWLKNRDELTFSYDVVQGERLPAGTPLGSAQIAITQTLSYFEQIQENIALDVKEMLYSVIIPQFQKEINGEHILRLVGKDLDTYISMIKGDMVKEEIVKQFSKGKLLSSYDAEVIGITIENALKQKGELLKEFPKDFYKDVKPEIDIDITGESVDTRVRNATKFAILQAIQSDPMMLQDPVKKRILFSIAEDGGINLNDFIGQEQKSIEAQMTGAMGQKMGGGGVSAPVLPQMSMAGNNMKTI
jgi:hypothetical protein